MSEKENMKVTEEKKNEVRALLSNESGRENMPEAADAAAGVHLVRLGNMLAKKGSVELENPELGKAVFGFGNFGDLTKPDSPGGNGACHIVQRRHEAEKLSPEEITSLLMLVSALAENFAPDGYDKTGTRAFINKSGVRVVLQKNWKDEGKSWVVSGYGLLDESKKLTIEATETIQAVTAMYGYKPEHSFLREQVGAVIASIPSIRQRQENVKELKRKMKEEKGIKTISSANPKTVFDRAALKSAPKNCSDKELISALAAISYASAALESKSRSALFKNAKSKKLIEKAADKSLRSEIERELSARGYSFAVSDSANETSVSWRRAVVMDLSGGKERKVEARERGEARERTQLSASPELPPEKVIHVADVAKGNLPDFDSLDWSNEDHVKFYGDIMRKANPEEFAKLSDEDVKTIIRHASRDIDGKAAPDSGLGYFEGHFYKQNGLSSVTNGERDYVMFEEKSLKAETERILYEAFVSLGQNSVGGNLGENEKKLYMNFHKLFPGAIAWTREYEKRKGAAFSRLDNYFSLMLSKKFEYNPVLDSKLLDFADSTDVNVDGSYFHLALVSNTDFFLEGLLDEDFDFENDAILLHCSAGKNGKINVVWQNHVQSAHPESQNSGRLMDCPSLSKYMKEDFLYLCKSKCDEFCRTRFGCENVAAAISLSAAEDGKKYMKARMDYIWEFERALADCQAQARKDGASDWKETGWETFMETAHGKEVVGYYLHAYPDAWLETWSENIRGKELTESDKEVEKMMKDLEEMEFNAVAAEKAARFAAALPECDCAKDKKTSRNWKLMFTEENLANLYKVTLNDNQLEVLGLREDGYCEFELVLQADAAGRVARMHVDKVDSADGGIIEEAVSDGFDDKAKAVFDAIRQPAEDFIYKKFPDDFKIAVNYVFPEDVEWTDKEGKDRKTVVYEEPRWAFRDNGELLEIIEEASPALLEEIVNYMDDRKLGKDDLFLDIGKSLRYDGAFSTETLEDKLNDRFIVRYSAEGDDGNLDAGGEEIVVDDPETVDRLNAMIRPHVAARIEQWREFEKNRAELFKEWLEKTASGESVHAAEKGDKDGFFAELPALPEGLSGFLGFYGASFLGKNKAYHPVQWRVWKSYGATPEGKPDLSNGTLHADKFTVLENGEIEDHGTDLLSEIISPKDPVFKLLSDGIDKAAAKAWNMEPRRDLESGRVYQFKMDYVMAENRPETADRMKLQETLLGGIELQGVPGANDTSFFASEYGLDPSFKAFDGLVHQHSFDFTVDPESGPSSKAEAEEWIKNSLRQAAGVQIVAGGVQDVSWSLEEYGMKAADDEKKALSVQELSEKLAASAEGYEQHEADMDGENGRRVYLDFDTKLLSLPGKINEKPVVYHRIEAMLDSYGGISDVSVESFLYDETVTHNTERFLPENEREALRKAMRGLGDKACEFVERELSNEGAAWTWERYDDNSGSLKSPAGRSFFHYDWTTNEYKKTSDGQWEPFRGAPGEDDSFGAFQEYAESWTRKWLAKDESVKFENKFIGAELTERIFEELSGFDSTPFDEIENAIEGKGFELKCDITRGSDGKIVSGRILRMDLDGGDDVEITVESLLKETIEYDDKEIATLHPGIDDDEIETIEGYVGKLENFLAKVTAKKFMEASKHEPFFEWESEGLRNYMQELSEGQLEALGIEPKEGMKFYLREKLDEDGNIKACHVERFRDNGPGGQDFDERESMNEKTLDEIKRLFRERVYEKFLDDFPRVKVLKAAATVNMAVEDVLRLYDKDAETLKKHGFDKIELERAWDIADRVRKRKNLEGFSDEEMEIVKGVGEMALDEIVFLYDKDPKTLAEHGYDESGLKTARDVLSEPGNKERAVQEEEEERHWDADRLEPATAEDVVKAGEEWAVQSDLARAIVRAVEEARPEGASQALYAAPDGTLVIHEDQSNVTVTLSVPELIHMGRERIAFDKIKERAEREGKFMLAPNGERSSLPELEWLFLNAHPELFKDWAEGDLDKNGEPGVEDIDYVWDGLKEREAERIEKAPQDWALKEFNLCHVSFEKGAESGFGVITIKLEGGGEAKFEGPVPKEEPGGENWLQFNYKGMSFDMHLFAQDEGGGFGACIYPVVYKNNGGKLTCDTDTSRIVLAEIVERTPVKRAKLLARDVFEYQHDGWAARVCHGVKEGSQEAKEAMADFLAKQIKEPTVLLPAPQHTGEAEYTLEIAEMIQKKLGPNMVSVCNTLVCDPHETMYDQKRSLAAVSAKPLSAEQISSLDAGNMRWREGSAQIFGKYIHWKHCLLDNVISTGRTFEEARKLVPDIEPLVFAASPLYLKDRAFEPATEKEIAGLFDRLGFFEGVDWPEERKELFAVKFSQTLDWELHFEIVKRNGLLELRDKGADGSVGDVALAPKEFQPIDRKLLAGCLEDVRSMEEDESDRELFAKVTSAEKRFADGTKWRCLKDVEHENMGLLFREGTASELKRDSNGAMWLCRSGGSRGLRVSADFLERNFELLEEPVQEKSVQAAGEELTCDNFSERLSEERRKSAGEDIMAVAGRLVERMKDPKELEKFRKICDRKGVRCPEDLKRLFDDISSGKDSFEIKPESQKRQKPAQRGPEM